MFTQVKTSKENKEIVTKLTNRLHLGAENVIARIAIAHSLALNSQVHMDDLKDAGGKEYSKNVLFGEFSDYYIGMICVHHQIYKSDPLIPKYIKLHLDNGLSLISDEIEQNPNIDGFDFLAGKIDSF